jgi:hypothetical protein
LFDGRRCATNIPCDLSFTDREAKPIRDLKLSYFKLIHMAIATSMLHRGFRGATGDFLFRTYNGKTVVSPRPVYRNETNTEARRKTRDHFREATFYAHHAMENPKQRSYYQQKSKQLKLPNAYTAAITDYLRRAKVKALTRSSFAARKGDVIFIRASKYPFMVNRLRVRAYTSQGDILAEHTLHRACDERGVLLTLLDDWPDFAWLKIVTDEPGYRKEYVLGLSDIFRSPYH